MRFPTPEIKQKHVDINLEFTRRYKQASGNGKMKIMDIYKEISLIYDVSVGHTRRLIRGYKNKPKPKKKKRNTKRRI